MKPLCDSDPNISFYWIEQVLCNPAYKQMKKQAKKETDKQIALKI